MAESLERDEDGVGDPDAALVSAYPAEAYDAVLKLLACRAQYLVGQRLAELYPTEAEVQQLLRDPMFIESITEFTRVQQDIALVAGVQSGFDPDRFMAAVAQHYERALDALYVLAERTGVSAEDLTAVLMR